MNFLPEYAVCKPESILRVGVLQVGVDTVLIAHSDAPIDKVLSIASQAIVYPSETLKGEARFAGTVVFKAIYVDKEGNIHKTEHSADFGDKIASEMIEQNTRPIFGCICFDTEVTSVTQNEIRASAVVDVRLDIVQSREVSYLTTGGDGVYCNNKQAKYDTNVCDVIDNLVLNDSFVDSTAINTLSAESNVFVKSCTPGLDVVVVQGVLACTVCYETDGGLLKSAMHNIPFVHEVSAPNCTADNVAIAYVDTKSFGAGTCADGGHISLEGQLGVRVCVFSSNVFSPVNDVFSVTHDLEKTERDISLNSVKKQLFCEDRIDGSVFVDDDSQFVDNILAITDNKIVVSSVQAFENSILVEGVFKNNLVYYNADQNTKNTVKAELPFSISIQDNNVNSDDVLLATGRVLGVVTKIRRGNEIELRVDVGFAFVVCDSGSASIISELNLGEERERPTSAFSIHIAKPKETLWDIAKVLGATPETIVHQNPNITMPLLGGERIIAYRQINK